MSDLLERLEDVRIRREAAKAVYDERAGEIGESYKTLKYRLLPGYWRRAAGLAILWRVSRRLGFGGHGDWFTPELLLIEAAMYKEGNFYRGRNYFPRWQQRIHDFFTRTLRYDVPYRVKLAARCILGLDISYIHDSCN